MTTSSHAQLLKRATLDDVILDSKFCPSNLDAERLILGAALLDNTLMDSLITGADKRALPMLVSDLCSDPISRFTTRC